jgi:hypothetical protein
LREFNRAVLAILNTSDRSPAAGLYFGGHRTQSSMRLAAKEGSAGYGEHF